MRIGSRCVTSAQETQAAFYDRMVSSKDCSQLADLNADPASYKVMADGSRLAPGLFLRGTWLRAGVLNTKGRRSRGGRGRLEDVDKLCKSRCGPVESIDHILQTCASTHDVRCERHNRIARLLAKQLRQKGYFVMEEVLVRKDTTFRKPDLLTRTGKEILVMDVCVAAPHLLELSWRLKKEKYDMDKVRSTAKQLLAANLPIIHFPVIFPSCEGLRKLGSP